MKKILYIIIYIVLMLGSLPAYGQEYTPRQIIQQAEEDYGLGRIEQALSLLQDNMDKFQGDFRQSALRLTALCYMSMDCDNEARYYARLLIRQNNYYNSTEDPARFQELISQLRENFTTTITTASSQSESINEAPVPITIITANMIEELGYNKNLGQILAAYVPGMTEITPMDGGDNMAMHGAYSMGQEFILIMENGHRLNTRFNNNGPTSYSVSTEKIDHIEVLRGPASSLYGNVALSAVVNIITKSGKAANGIKMKYGNATYNTHKGDLTIGTQFMDADIFAWASIYKSDGQIRNFSDGEGYMIRNMTLKDEFDLWSCEYLSPDKIYVDAYKDTPAYDVGLEFRLKGFDVMFSRKNVKKVYPCTEDHGGFDYDRYEMFNGVKPGYGTESTHAEISYTRQFRHTHLSASLYSDWYTINDYEVRYDSLMDVSPAIDDNYDYIYDENGNMVFETTYESSNFVYRQIKEHTMGGALKVSNDYRIGNMKGHILAGSQYEYFSLKNKYYLWGEDFKEIKGGSLDFIDIVRLGKEKSLSFFLQDKHFFLPQLILNAGFRYDLKYRQETDVVKSFSPRLALMYVPYDWFNLKLSYSEAFADLAYYYRYMVSDTHFTIDPQHLSAVQLTMMGTLASQHLNYEVNLFYNRYTNLLCWLARDIDEEDFYVGKNTGQLTNIGIEGTAQYAHKRLSAYLTLYYCKDISSKHYFYATKEKKVNNVPHFTLNLHGAWKMLQLNRHELKVYAHSSYTGSKLCFQQWEENQDYNVDSTLLLDMGIQYRYNQRLQLALDCENILNTDHYICGPNEQNAPYFQRGRTLMASFSYQF